MTRVPGPPPTTLRKGIDRLQAEATSRYGDGLVEVSFTDAGLRGTVALLAQAAEIRRLVDELWPAAGCRLLVLATRRARVALYPESEPLDIWRRRPDDDQRPQELTTQLLPGDPPAGLLAIRDGQYLVKAPGEAVGWVPQTARYRLGPAQPAEATGAATGPESRWDPTVVRKTALDLLGCPYVFGGTGSQGIDCSGLSWRAYLAAGVLLPRNSRAQRKVGDRVRLAELRESDIICAVHRGPKRTSHVALYLGQDEVVHACSEWNQVRRERLGEFRNRYQVLTVRRVPGAVGLSR
ncbi:MAG TPA: NlpC/P60 family protein [Candidatus Acidoferrales bacterium]|nr:NlpC/P60 family protein [Candidatus Acidoferrales bacterium]